MQTAASLIQRLKAQANPADALFLRRFFKIGPGQYGEGDIFLGIRVPVVRTICKDFWELPLIEVEKVLGSPLHECRLAALIILCRQYPCHEEEVYQLYLKALAAGFINNWDLVDVSAEYVVGLHEQGITPDLIKLSQGSLWQRRVAIISSFAAIKKGRSQTTLLLAERLLHDPEDLIQKATGWMLREVGKRVSEADLYQFLDIHATQMPRTMLRYAIERLPEAKRKEYMNRN